MIWINVGCHDQGDKLFIAKGRADGCELNTGVDQSVGELCFDASDERHAGPRFRDSFERPRLATSQTKEAHREKMRDLTRSVHEKSLFGDIRFSDAKFDRTFDKTLSGSQQHLGLVVLLKDRVLGCCYCSIGGYFIGDRARIVSVNTICVEPEVSGGLLGGKVALRLAKGIEVWARSKQAMHILYHVTAGGTLPVLFLGNGGEVHNRLGKMVALGARSVMQSFETSVFAFLMCDGA